uniref:Uncharacterized protein n=1 Tax=Romanomermis culicivorax TaxID=13658 RepID=A0A915II61_ROMCU
MWKIKSVNCSETASLSIEVNDAKFNQSEERRGLNQEPVLQSLRNQLASETPYSPTKFLHFAGKILEVGSTKPKKISPARQNFACKIFASEITFLGLTKLKRKFRQRKKT